MGRKLLLIGGGGHCRSVLSSVIALNEYSEIGIIDYTDTSILDVPVVGRDEDLPELRAGGWTDAFVTVGSVGNTELRHRLYQLIVDLGFNVPAIIDATAIIAQDAKIETGSFVGKGVIINSGTRVEKCAIINTGSIIEHDCQIGEFVHISPGAVLCGQVTVGSDSHVGAGTVVRQQVIIANNVLIGAGSVVVQNMPDGIVAYGNPCKVVK